MIGSDAYPALCPDWVISAVLAVFVLQLLSAGGHPPAGVGGAPGNGESAKYSVQSLPRLSEKGTLVGVGVGTRMI